MNCCPTALFFLLLVSFACGEPAPDFKGRGGWGNETAGFTCRITAAQTDYRIGEPISVQFEVRNLSDKAIILYAELPATLPGKQRKSISVSLKKTENFPDPIPVHSHREQNQNPIRRDCTGSNLFREDLRFSPGSNLGQHHLTG